MSSMQAISQLRMKYTDKQHIESFEKRESLYIQIGYEQGFVDIVLGERNWYSPFERRQAILFDDHSEKRGMANTLLDPL